MVTDVLEILGMTEFRSVSLRDFYLFILPMAVNLL